MSKITLNTPTIAWSLQLALFASLLMPDVVWLLQGHSLALATQALILPAALLLLFYALLGQTIWLANLLLAPLVILAPIESLYIFYYGRPTSAEVFATLFASNTRETREFLGNSLAPVMLSLGLATTLASSAVWCAARARLRWQGRAHAWVLSIGLITPLAATAVSVATNQGTIKQRLGDTASIWSTFLESTETGYPFGLMQRFASYRQEWAMMRADASKRAAFRFSGHRVESTPGRQVYVLVIGESSRRDHWQLYGYGRATNQELSLTSNIIPIADMITSWPATVTAVPLMLTRKPISSMAINFKEASILRVMQEAGYETYWVSNQLAIGKYDSPVASYAYEAGHVRWLNHTSWSTSGSYDENLLSPLRDILENAHSDAFIVLHMMGSHAGYDFRYPPEFRRFAPTQSDEDSKISSIERTTNSYDNSVLYTDHVLAKIIEVLKASGATSALWYESDHGEMLPTQRCDLSGHGIGTDAEFRIPAFFWYSASYLKAFPSRVTSLQANAGNRTLSADTFESLVDMAGVDFPGHDRKRSLFSHEWQYRPRIVNSYWHTDFDHSVLGKRCPVVIPSDINRP